MAESSEREHLRVGTDLVNVDEVAASIERFGDRYLSRIFTSQETAACSGPNGPSAERLAARFAAKESVVKVLQPAG
jgi:holo-[acyl-carrier protein] synthase